MAKSENFDNEEAVTEGLEKRNSVPSRRRFIRNIAIGTAGAAVAMGNLDRLRGASRLLERLTNAHVDGFLDHIKDATPSPQAKQEFQRLANLIFEAVGNDPKSRETYTAIKHYLSNPVVPTPQAVKPSDIDLVMGAAYLRAVDGIQHSTRQVSADDIKKRLQNPKAILHIFESGFLNQLFAQTKTESTTNPGFAKRIDEASKEAKGVASHLVDQARSLTGPRLVPASFVQGCDCTIDIGNGPVCQPWEVCVGAVILIVVIFVILK